ncbi:nSTAND1 domain-containing NTPase [Embleya sp. NPDC001921]
MGRRERPLDPTAGPVAHLAYELRELRRKSGGLTYREMASRAGYSTATLAQAAAGERLPSLAVTLAYVRACGGDTAAWELRWHETVRVASEESAADRDPAASPYPGLARFEVDDHARFFGRDELVERLAGFVRKRPFVTVLGPSGSGKTSLLRAGLVWHLRHGPTDGERPPAIRLLTPGPQPARTHEGALSPANTRPGTVIVVDQFEEIFTLCTDPGERACFVDLLLTVGRPEHGARVVVAVRADFFGRCAEFPELFEAIREGTLAVPPMGSDELRQAIIGPAAACGLIVERGLTARIVAEIANEPAALPLMSHALRETWRRRRGRALTEETFEAAGGLRGAIARTTEDLYAASTPAQIATARRILLRLVTPGQGTPDTRCPTHRDRFTADDPSTVAHVLERLVRARIVVLDGEMVDIAHEAVFTACPRLRAWIEEDRERLRVRGHLTEAATTWDELGRDAAAVYRGLRLAMVEEHFGPHPDRSPDLTPLERAFVTASIGARSGERRRRTLRLAVSSILVVLTLLVASVAWQQNRLGERRRIEAEARRVAGVAATLRLSDPLLAMRLSVAAWRLADLPETRSGLLAAMSQKEQDAFTDPNTDADTMRGLSADGRTLLSVGAAGVTEWSVDTHRAIRSMPGLGQDTRRAGAIRSDARMLPLFVGEYEETLVLHEVATGRRDGTPLTSVFGGAETTTSGRALITYDTAPHEYVVRLWDTRRRDVLLELREGRQEPTGEPVGADWSQVQFGLTRLLRERRVMATVDGAFPDAVVGPDDRLLALCVPGQSLQLWDTAERRRLDTPWAPRVTTAECLQERVRFTPDGGQLVVVSDSEVRSWDIASGRERTKITHADLKQVEFSADGRFLVASDGAEILLWRVDREGPPVYRYVLAGETAADLRIDPAAGWIRYLGGPTGSWGSTVRTLSLGLAADARWEERPVVASVFSPDGSLLAVASPTAAGERLGFRILDVRARETVGGPREASCRPGCGVYLAFGADGRRLVHGTGDSARLSLWDTVERRETSTVDLAVLGGEPVSAVAFGPDDRTLLLSHNPGNDEPTVLEWDIATRTATRTIAGAGGNHLALRPDGRMLITGRGQVVGLPSGEPIRTARSPGKTSALAFSADGRLLAAGEFSGSAIVWDGGLQRRLGVLTDPNTVTYQYVSALAFSPDGRVLAVAGDEGSLRLWDTASAQPIGAPLATPGDVIHALSFSADGDTLYAAGQHVPIQSYGIGVDAAAATVCRRAGAGLPRDDWNDYIRGTSYRRTCDPAAPTASARRDPASGAFMPAGGSRPPAPATRGSLRPNALRPNALRVPGRSVGGRRASGGYRAG